MEREFNDALDLLVDKINYFGMVEEVLVRMLDFKIRETVCDILVDHEEEYHKVKK